MNANVLGPAWVDDEMQSAYAEGIASVFAALAKLAQDVQTVLRKFKF